jgi:serine/threonine protein kinase
MLSFRCPSCQLKLTIRPEFAGRASRCPTCKQPLTVPSPDLTQAYAPPQQIDGEESGLAKIGHTGCVTLEHGLAGHKPTPVPKPPGLAETDPDGRKPRSERYAIEGELARGGMGAVLRARDGDLGREVAVKYLLDESNPTKKTRFIEEAQINAQLEHPNIVPVYDLRIDPQGRPYLLMKLVKGRDLKSVLDQLREHPKQAAKEWSLGRLLNILVGVCNGLAFAHAQGVIHRDLKPANIMLGDFGEVYVMDWGLAKVLKETIPPSAPLTEDGTFAAFKADRGETSSRYSSRVSVSREDEADLTQDGSIVGTPVYMPPEQATGRVQAIDERSDVYALGAILYEMLTLQPPLDKEGGYLAILTRVAAGEILAPEQRAPQRARAGNIPRELAAIAMKALAKDPGQRYPNVDELRQDIERFQEGRSVSAKQDTFRETAWKLVKRNRGASLATAAAAVVLVGVAGFFLKINYDARIEAESQRTRAEQALGAFEQEQKDKQERTRQAIPALIVAARQVANASNFMDAQKQVDLALLYEPTNADAHLLKGQLLLGRKEWTAARAELEQYLQKKPNDTDVRQLLNLCSSGRVNDPVTQFGVAGVLGRQNMPGPAVPLLKEVAVAREQREPLLPIYQKQIEVNWKGLGGQLSLLPDAQFGLDFDNTHGARPVTSLEPLKGMQLNVLNLTYNPVSDLTPLQGMPLTYLNLLRCSLVRDLAPLKGMPLTFLNLQGCHQLKDLTPLKGLPLNGLILSECQQAADLTPLQGLPLTSLELNSCSQVRDLTLLKGMPLTLLNLGGCNQVRDLTPLQGMPLTYLNLLHCSLVRDLAPLKGMPLTFLSLQECSSVSDLTPLKGMPLSSLHLSDCPNVKDLTPLQGMNLTEIYLNLPAKGMDVLREMKSLVRINQLPPAEFWKKYDAGEFK